MGDAQENPESFALPPISKKQNQNDEVHYETLPLKKPLIGGGLISYCQLLQHKNTELCNLYFGGTRWVPQTSFFFISIILINISWLFIFWHHQNACHHVYSVTHALWYLEAVLYKWLTKKHLLRGE